jgi:hypothetical protein
MIEFHRLGTFGSLEFYIIFEVFMLLVFKSSISKFFNLKIFFFFFITLKRMERFINNNYS